jgi:hypothetical protein
MFLHTPYLSLIFILCDLPALKVRKKSLPSPVFYLFYLLYLTSLNTNLSLARGSCWVTRVNAVYTEFIHNKVLQIIQSSDQYTGDYEKMR